MNLETLTLPLAVSSSAFNAGLKVAAAGVTALIGAMGVAIKATFDWANDIDSLGDVLDGTNEDMAALAFIARKSGVGVDALRSSNVILQKSLLKTNGELDTAGKKLKEYGIDVRDANGQVKDSAQLTDEIAQAYGRLGTQQERVNFLTEIYGKNGASMVDFYDTLLADGGIGTVTEKIKALGLALDPGRYEQFNRNLEEMKLIGLGLAVGFTEKVMPMLESLTSWFMTKGVPALVKFGESIRKAFDGGGILGVVDMLLDGFDNIDWAGVSTAIVNGINSIDWAQAGTDFSALVKRVSESLKTAFGDFDWLALGNSLASAMNNFIAGMMGTDESGMQVIVKEKLDAIQSDIVLWANGLPSSLDGLDQSMNAGVEGVFTLIKTTNATRLEEIKSDWTLWASGMPSSLDTLDEILNGVFVALLDTIKTTNATRLEEIKQNWKKWGADTWAVIDPKLKDIDASFATWSVNVGDTVKTWGSNTLAETSKTMETLKNNMGAKVAAITEIFTSRFGSIPRKAAEAFNAGREALIGVVRTIVEEINKILARIRTSFGLTFTGVNMGGSTGTSGTSNLGSGGGGSACFIAGTLVTLANGTTTPVERIQKGDLVRSWHNGAFISAEIVETFVHPPEDAPALVRINGKLTATPEHLIYVYSARDWIAAGGLRIGDSVIENGKPVPVTRLQKIPGGVPVYNLHTDHESHNYFANGILVHNAKDPKSAEAGAQTVFIGNWADFDYNRLATDMVKAMNNA